jgi:sec-independent protein translocase protein TatC
MWLLFEAGVICGSMIGKRDSYFRGDEAEEPAENTGDQPPAPRP